MQEESAKKLSLFLAFDQTPSMTPSFRLFAVTLAGAAWFASPVVRADPIRHDFIAIDEGMSNLFRVDEGDASKNWLVHIGKPHPRDMQLEGGGKLLISHDHGYSEYDISNGAQLTDVSTFHDVSSARRLPNGDMLVAGVDFDGVKKNKSDNALGDPAGRHVLVVEYDPQGRQVRRTTYVGDYLRLIRITAAGTFLFSCNTVFKEGDENGNFISREFHADGFKHAWKAIRLANGNTLTSAGYGAFMAEFDPEARLIRKFGAADQVPPDVHPYFYGLFQLLSNGDVVVANWQGHGPGHGGQGAQLIEFDPQGRIVWRWDNSQHAVFSSIQGVLVLDGLDPALRYDERNGVMEPLADVTR